MIVKLLIEGGDMKPGPAVAQQLGPLGINLGKVISEINKATAGFKGMKVPVELHIDEKTKNFEVKTSSPPASELLKKEIKVEKGSSKHREIKVGNASIEDVIKVAKIKHSSMLEKDFKSAVKSILGTCASIGMFVENKEPKEVISEIEQGKFGREIAEQSAETTPEKRKQLNDFFNGVKSAQDEKLAKEKQAAEESEEAKKQEEKKTAEKKPAEKKAEEKKPAEKKSAEKKPAVKKSADKKK